MNKIIVLVLINLLLAPIGFAKQKCNAAINLSSHSSEFTNLNDGTVKHKETGLIWMQCNLGQSWQAGDCKGMASQFTWFEALDIVDSVNLPGAGWRLPNIKELRSIVEYSCVYPAIDSTVFPNAVEEGWGKYPERLVAWSSTPSAKNGQYAWVVNFGYGGAYDNYKHLPFTVRLVRDAD